MLGNLITNAAKYNEKPDKWIEVGTAASAAAGEIVFYVRDNGIGIPPERFETIFSMFRRLHGRDKYGGGSGAGLSIVKKILERHGARVWLESVIGGGTTFCVALPESLANGR